MTNITNSFPFPFSFLVNPTPLVQVGINLFKCFAGIFTRLLGKNNHSSQESSMQNRTITQLPANSLPEWSGGFYEKSNNKKVQTACVETDFQNEIEEYIIDSEDFVSLSGDDAFIEELLEEYDNDDFEYFETGSSYELYTIPEGKES